MLIFMIILLLIFLRLLLPLNIKMNMMLNPLFPSLRTFLLFILIFPTLTFLVMRVLMLSIITNIFIEIKTSSLLSLLERNHPLHHLALMLQVFLHVHMISIFLWHLMVLLGKKVALLDSNGYALNQRKLKSIRKLFISYLVNHPAQPLNAVKFITFLSTMLNYRFNFTNFGQLLNEQILWFNLLRLFDPRPNLVQMFC